MLNRIVVVTRSYCSSSTVMKWLFVAEKNDAAKTIAGFLSKGRSQRRDGIATFNKIYEFEAQIRGQHSKVIMTSVSGHLLNKDFVGTYRKWQGCSPEQLFDAPIQKTCDARNEPIKKQLEKEIRTCNGLVIWTDCDREGENIGFEVIDVCRAVKNNIQVFRAKFSDMTAASIFRAVNNLQAPDDRQNQAVEVRSELDLRIGAAFTRFQTLRLQRLFPDQITDNLVSYGSCQFPTLGFVADRYREIEKFIKSEFWKIKLQHKVNNLTVDFNWARNRLFDQNSCQALLNLCKAAKQAEIMNVQQKPKNKWRPQPMDTIELEKTGSRKLRLSAKAIMTIAEKLYTQGLISYPRTETNQFSKDINLVPLVEMQTPSREWGDFAQRVLEWGPNPRNGNKSDQAHPPIHPTKFIDTLTGDEKKVYELITRHFLACVSKDAVGHETLVNAEMGGEEFNATGLIIIERNYLDVYIYDRWTGKEIHNYQIGTTFIPTKLDIEKGETSPPNLLTEADLIALMEKHGIGTDATHAEHIATIKDREYIGVVNNGQLVPGKLGMALVEGYELMELTLSKPQLRAGLEVDLKGICNGIKNPEDVLREQIEIYRGCFKTIIEKITQLDRAMENRFGQAPAANVEPVIAVTTVHELFKCPKCSQSSIVVRRKKDNSGSFLSCQGYPQCKHAIWLDSDIKEIVSIDEKCTNCGGINHKVRVKFAQINKMALVDENPAYSRIDGYTYVTCLVCDSNLRNLLNIPHTSVKALGNVVGVASRPIHQAPPNNQARNFGTNGPPQAPPSNISQNRRNWFHNGDDDDDDNQAPRRGNQGTSSGGWGNNQGTSSGGWNNNQNQRPSNSSVKCNCNQPSMRLVCKKEGPNQNRPFLKCAKGTCKFFQWDDQQGSNNNVSNAGNRQPQNNNNAGGSKQPRRCGICRQTGHTRANCPNNT